MNSAAGGVATSFRTSVKAGHIMMAIKPESKPAPLLTAREVARQLSVSVAWVLEHARGRHHPILPSISLGRAVRFRQSDIDQFIEHCRRCMAKGLPIS
jgi:excisionase family DNA binding protein